MWIKDLFKKRRPNHLIIYINYKKEEFNLYNLLSKFTHSVGPYKSLDETIEGIKKFITKHPYVLKQINLTSYGTGKKLVQTEENYEKIKEVIDALKPLMTKDTKLMFTTCFTGISYRKIVEMSEYLDGIEVSAIRGEYKTNVPMTRCSCKDKGYSDYIVSKLPPSKNGMRYDENKIADLVRRDLGEEINWVSAGMAYEYNRLVTQDGICYVDKQPYTLFKSIRNYIFNIQD
jgi:hypothetical protein